MNEKMDFLSPDNQCGQNLLRIVARGSSIIAELLRLSTNIPEVFFGGDKVKDPEQRKYLDVLFDFTYLRGPEEYEKKLNDNADLADLDREFLENHSEILDRFYKLFESIWKYQADISKYVDDVMHGYYLQHSLDNILQDIGGRQLLSEVLYLYGIILLLLEDKMPGFIREKMLIALYRLNGEVGLENFEPVCKLCRNSGYVPGPDGKRPKNHPEGFMARFAPHPELVRLVIGRLQTDDIYLMANCFPSPEHRSTRLANQAAMLFVILYFAPDILHNNKATMREVVDKYFNDNWVIASYMGTVVDLTSEWAQYPAAKTAIDNIITPGLCKKLHEDNMKLIQSSIKELELYLKEGVLTQEYILDNIETILNCIRHCNIALRWRFMHKRCKNEIFRKIIETSLSNQTIVTLLLNSSQLEYILKNMLQQLLNEKDIAWTDGKSQAADRMIELSEYFTGEKALSRVKRDENLMKWFSSLATEVSSLNLVDSHATATGRKIKSIMKALEDVEQFEAVDTNIQIKTFLQDAREIFRTMIRTVNIQNEILNNLDVISDLSYAWQTLSDYIQIFQERITRDPKSVVLLRAVFLKAASMLDVPLVRITSIDSPDAVSVASYYSNELVEFVRMVLEIIPISVFNILGRIVSLQNKEISNIPIRLEAKDLKDHAQLDARYELAKLTHEVSIFTEGILVMEKTLLGIIQVDPRLILEEGLRRELVRKLSLALHQNLTFKDYTRKEIYENMNQVAMNLDSIKKSIEYLQDYIGIAGLKIFQQEFSRTINYNTEQEANRFIKKKIFDSMSRYQNKKIPIPKLISSYNSSNPNSSVEDSNALTFMGRIMCSMLALTDPINTVYAPECSAWFEHPAPDVTTKNAVTIETCGIRTFALLEKSIGVFGLRGLDRLLAFRTVNVFNQFLKFYSSQVHPFRTLLDQVSSTLLP
jgi:WASH complex subunit strumpellin